MDAQVQQWLAEGIAKAKAGQVEEARELLLRVIERDERNVPAWLWLSGVVRNPQDRRIALENVLAIEPDNPTAKAGLDWLNRQVAEESRAPASVQDYPHTPPQASVAQPADDELPPEQEGCPYCGQPVEESDQRCPHCAGLLTIRVPKSSGSSARVGMITVMWLVQAVADLVDGVLMVMALQSLGGTRAIMGAAYINTYLAGAAFKSGLPVEELLRAIRLFIACDVVASVWSLVVALTLPRRRPAAPAVALLVATFHFMLAGSSLVLGMSSLFVAPARIALALFIGFWLLEAHGDFDWQSVRQRLELDTSARSAMDYYTQGRYYRRIGQTAKAILHLKRAVELNPKWFDYRVALANAYYALGRLDSTAEQLRAALQFNPDAPDVREFLDIVMARMSAGQAARE